MVAIVHVTVWNPAAGIVRLVVYELHMAWIGEICGLYRHDAFKLHLFYL